MQKQGGNLVSYFCTPDGRVLHFVVGAVSSNSILEAADWALKEFAAGNEKDFGAEFLDAHRDNHTAAIPEAFRNVYKGKRATVASADPLSVEKMVALAVDSQLALLTPQFANLTGNSHPNPHLRNVAKRQVTGTLPHLILSQHPLAELSAIGEPVFELLAGEEFNPYSERNAELATQVKLNIEQRVPTLLVIEPQFGAALLPGGAAQPSSVPNNVSVQRHLKSMRVVSLSNDELTWLLADLDQPTVAVRRGETIQFVVLDAKGEQIAALQEDTPTSVLARFLAMAVKSVAAR